MNKLILTLLALTISSLSFADYVVKVPIETSMGGSLPNGSITFKAAAVEAPVESNFDFSAFNGIGVLDWTQASGDFEAKTFNNPAYNKVLLRGYGLHSVWLSGIQTDLDANYSKIVVMTASGSFDCIKSGSASVIYGEVTETVFHCEVAAGYTYNLNELGQNISISFN